MGSYKIDKLLTQAGSKAMYNSTDVYNDVTKSNS